MTNNTKTIRNHEIKLTTAQAATLLKSLCKAGGDKDVIEHIIDMVGGHDQNLLNKIFQSLDSKWNPAGEFKVGQTLSVREWNENYKWTVLAIDKYSSEPIQVRKESGKVKGHNHEYIKELAERRTAWEAEQKAKQDPFQSANDNPCRTRPRLVKKSH